ncbi:ABC transporter permease (plasmid) [Clostridium septicum]|uniref:ABC transporter permease n=1 Tax=Clostridium septicum TaxID=1504 RepID=UPI00083058FA|nr:ABC transporter permease [Clostridium septicum]
MKVFIRKLYDFIRLNCSLLLCYAMVTIFVIMMAANYVSNKELNTISRGFLTSSSQKFNVSINIDVLDLEEIIRKTLPKEGAIFRKGFSDENVTGVYKKKSFDDPPLIRGRFLDEEESFSNKKIAVVGQGLQHSFINDNGRDWIKIDGINYEVIGVIGTDYSSRLDSMIFIPLGVVNRQYDIKGEVIVDGVNNPEKILDKIMSNSNGKVEFSRVKDKKIMGGTFDPKNGKQTEEVLSSNELNENYLTSYIYLIVFISALLCIISISIYWIKKIKKEIIVCNLLGFYKGEIFIRCIKQYIKVVLLGSILGSLFSIVCLNIL